MSAEAASSRAGFGIAGMVCGGLALLVAIFHFWAGPLEHRKPVERTIAETAVNISKEIAKVARNKPAATQARTWTADDGLRIGAGLAGGIAVLLAAIGYVRREDHRPVAAATAIGAGAIAFQFITWVALLAAGLVLIWIVVTNLGELVGT